MLELKICRVKQRLTQEQLSKLSGVSRITISNIERKGIENVPVSTLKKLSKALGCTIQELFFNDIS